jgi:hypothetical protein
MRINHKLAAVATVAVMMASGGGVAYAADASCPGMGGTAGTGTTTTTASSGTTTTTAATTSSVRRHSKRHVTRHSGRL